MINFEKVSFEEIPLLISWFKKEHIREYWVSILNKTDEEITNKYMKRLKEDVIEMFIIKKNNVKIGFIQTYLLEDPKQFMISDKCKGIDLFIGDEKFLNQGFGTETLKRFLKNKVFSDSSIKFACIDPEVKNKRAIRAYEKVGFKHVNTDFDKYSKLLTYYMVIDRDDFLTLSNTMV